MIGLWLAGCLAWAPPVDASAPPDDPDGPHPVQGGTSPAYVDVLEPLPEGQRDEEAAKLLMVSAKSAFGDQRYEEAIEFLAQAYRTYPYVTLLYSLGSAHRRVYERDQEIEHRQLSIRRYQQYLSAAPGAEYSSLAQNYLTALLAERDLGELGVEVVTRILVSTPVEGATMMIDGGAELPAPGVISVEPGVHEINISAPGYHEFVRSLDVPDGATYQIQAELEEMDGVVHVAGPKGAWVHIDGDVVGQLPLSEAVRAIPGEHVVSVTKNGYEGFSRDIELERAGDVRVNAVLNTSTQRVASYFLMGIGGAGLIGGAVLVGLAVDRQTRALALADLREMDQLSLEDHQSYVDLVNERDSLRTGALISGIGGAALFITGVVLFGYDKPGLGAGRGEVGQLQVRPVLGPTTTGVTASLRF